MALRTPCFQTSRLEKCEKINSCCFKPLSLGQLVMAAPGNKCNTTIC